MTFEEIEILIKNLLTQINELQENNTLLQNEIATLKTSIAKIDHLENLNDVKIDDVSPLTEGDILQYSNDGKWHNINIKNIKFDIPEAPKNLSDLSDVVFSNINNNNHLIYSVELGKWTNSSISDDSDETDLSNYLTKTEAAKTYFPFVGGTITGPTTIKSYLHTTGNITSEAAVTAKQSTI